MLRNHGSREKLKRRYEGHLFPVIVKYLRALLPSEEEDVDYGTTQQYHFFAVVLMEINLWI